MPGLFFVYFRLFKQILQFLQEICGKCPFSLQSEGRVTPPITTRLGFLEVKRGNTHPCKSPSQCDHIWQNIVTSAKYKKYSTAFLVFNSIQQNFEPTLAKTMILDQFAISARCQILSK